MPVAVGRGGTKRSWRALELAAAAAEVGLGFAAAGTPAPAPTVTGTEYGGESEGGSMAGGRRHARGGEGEISPRRLGVRARSGAIARAGERAPNLGRAGRRNHARLKSFTARTIFARLLGEKKWPRARDIVGYF